MTIKYIFNNYFKSCAIIYSEKATDKEKCLAKVCIASYFLIVLPILFAIGYGLSCLCHWRWEAKQVQGESFPLKYPIVSNKEGLFIEALNEGGYVLNGKNVTIPPAQPPIKYERLSPFKDSLHALKETYKINEQNRIKLQFKDQTTEYAINESTGFPIALNFANENHAGGGPGFHQDPTSGLLIYDCRSARAQEESLAQRSTLLVSLLQLTQILKADSSSAKLLRSMYAEKFNSREMAYLSDNHLFGVQGMPSHFYESLYLEEPKAVCFVTSAATCYGNIEVDCSENSDVYKDARERIETHLLAAAHRAGVSKREQPDLPIELILGAFGCGAFAPLKNPNAYRQMIANIYGELLCEFHGFFDVITFAVPTLGQTDPSHAAVINHNVFKDAVQNYHL